MKTNKHIRFYITYLLVCSALVLSIPNSFGQLQVRKYSNEFLNIGVGARAIGMANTQVAISADGTSAYWNPAGLLLSKDKYEVNAMHTEHFAGIAKYDFLGFSVAPDTLSRLSISAIRLGVDDIPDTRFLVNSTTGAIQYDKISYFSASDYAFMVSYARKFPKIPGLRIGGNAKIIYRNVGKFANAWGFGIDGGIQYTKNTWHFGAMIRDVTGTYTTWVINTELLKDSYIQTGNELPKNSTEVTLPQSILGVGKYVPIRDKFGILMALDAAITYDGKRNTVIKSNTVSVSPLAGIELDYKKTVYLRGGVGNIQKVKTFDQSMQTQLQPNFGIGIRIKRFSIDYALTNIGNASDALFSNIFSLKIGINR